MDGPSGVDQETPIDRVARITLALGGFMLILLIAVPFTFESGTSGYFASYVIYSLFLTSVGVIIGVSLMWLNDPRRQPAPEIRDIPSTPRMLSADQQTVVGILSSNGSMWQAELVRETGFTDSKASRLLSRMEAEGHIRRIRDGMGKRVELAEEGN
ncbi:MAG: MarR family transcriptional regulator [Candidatus Thalassarchaeaceae archaeon]|jgi:hypothetical protein|nr:MarR family transcriptional regulator [Candidatus Thalassarchaeaceae archaeon]|tara:strand:+ start:997 stop:1464 length:468 start_codon:yes stop_codon:yes gene_type:complete